jgi:hypothetical protein
MVGSALSLSEEETISAYARPLIFAVTHLAYNVHLTGLQFFAVQILSVVGQLSESSVT